MVRAVHMAHHQKTARIHVQLARGFDVLFGDIGLCAVRGYTHGPHAERVRMLQVVDGADAGNQQCGQPRMRHHLGNRLDPFPISMRPEPVGEAGAVQPVAMRHLDGVHPCVVQRARNCAHLVQIILVLHRMHAVAQRHVLDVQPGRGGIEKSHAAALVMRRWAIASAVCRAAEVMMSRLPA